MFVSWDPPVGVIRLTSVAQEGDCTKKPFSLLRKNITRKVKLPCAVKWFLFLLVCQKEANFGEVKWRRPSAASVRCQVNWNCVLTLVLLEKWTTAARLGTWRTRVNGETWLAVHMSDASFCDNVVFQWNVWHYKDEGVGWRYWNLARSISDLSISLSLSLSLSLETIADDDFCDISVESHAVTLKYLAETDLCSRWAKFHFVQREWQSFPADWRLSWTRVRETDRSVSKKVISGVCVGLSASIELSETSKAFLSGVSCSLSWVSVLAPLRGH